ncbi:MULTISPECIES: hypothetical protein [Brucella]|nr:MULTISPECIES: hypothetical protein [Brucella]EEX83240.1 predicted protein [Brucella abortus bv. 3 str. Tulya]MBJ8147526.1 hypothetical protein [Brucella abortus]
MNITVMRAISMAVFVIFIRGGLQIWQLPVKRFCTASLSAYMMGMKKLRFNICGKAENWNVIDERK